MQIAKISETPFLLDVIRNALSVGKLSQEESDSLHAEGIDMSLNIAKKYYNIMYCDGLRYASEITMGICTLGLMEEFQSNEDLALDFLKAKGMMGAFKLGWKIVDQAAAMRRQLHGQNYEDVDSSVRYVFDIVSCSEKGIYDGSTELAEENKRMKEQLLPGLLLQYFNRHIIKHNPIKELVLGLEFKHFNTFFTQILLDLEISENFSKDNFDSLENELSNKLKSRNEIKEKIISFKEEHQIPKEFDEAFDIVLNEYLDFSIPENNCPKKGVFANIRYIVKDAKKNFSDHLPMVFEICEQNALLSIDVEDIYGLADFSYDDDLDDLDDFINSL